MHQIPCRTLLLAVLFGASACRGAPPPAPLLACTLVQLKTGARTAPLGREEQQQVFGGHFDNMARLAAERHLLVAGPYGQSRTDPTLRGIFILDTEDRAAAQRLAESDPAFRAGVFRFEYHAFVTAAPLRAFLEGELATLAAARREGRTPAPGEGGRTYVLLQAEQGERAEAALRHHAAVLLLGRLDGTRVLALLDAPDPAAAEALLAPVAGQLGPHTLDAWFGSGALAQLPRLQRS